MGLYRMGVYYVKYIAFMDKHLMKSILPTEKQSAEIVNFLNLLDATQENKYPRRTNYIIHLLRETQREWKPKAQINDKKKPRAQINGERKPRPQINEERKPRPQINEEREP